MSKTCFVLAVLDSLSFIATFHEYFSQTYFHSCDAHLLHWNSSSSRTRHVEVSSLDHVDVKIICEFSNFFTSFFHILATSNDEGNVLELSAEIFTLNGSNSFSPPKPFSVHLTKVIFFY
jgi:hypothetical protein